MAVYTYIATARDGKAPELRGTIVADSPRQARDQLRERGLSVRDVAEERTSARSAVERFLAGRQRDKVTSLLQEMSTLLAAGIPLLETLETIARQHQGRFRQSILLLNDAIAAGGSLAQAMAQQPELFDELALSVVEVGENAGTLDSSLKRLAEFRRKASRLKNRVLSAMLYPAIVATVGVLVSVFLMTFVVPQVLTVLEDSGKDLPFATVIVKGASDILLGYWWLILAAILAAILAVSALLRTDRGAYAWHRFQLRVPILGDLIRKQSIARMAMVMATLLSSDVVFVRTLQITRRIVGNRVLRDALVAAEQAVLSGRDIADALEKTEAFPPLVVQIFAVGQASGRLEEMLESLAEDYDTQVDLTADRLTSMLEPVMMIALAITVGFIAFAVIMPILEAGNVL
ncbi:type II secretion system F family protein [Mucisphaera calidilacus]|uniref:General secretion pathway protein F n=1 Tax=Mucisphaera calidilacus TaxID=2527982 RepID=A0A518BUK2_9BACT|nr:type II secretion system F family protein [Mucisphaera calidilacus]QDU70607.1 Type II secretion system protein F [Mucisphaera calidilacus]